MHGAGDSLGRTPEGEFHSIKNSVSCPEDRHGCTRMDTDSGVRFIRVHPCASVAIRFFPYDALRGIPDWSRAQRLLNSGWMLRKLTALGVFVLALAPSAYLAWTLRAMPHLGFYHDDSIYWVSAKTLREGHEYRIASLPGQPYQTKYPPLYPALLAGIWKIDPNFPTNLPLATLFAWLLLPIYLAMVWLFLRQYGFGWREQCILVLVAGLSPIAATFSFSLMPELLFTALLVASVLLAERSLADDAPVWLPVLAGACGALA